MELIVSAETRFPRFSSIQSLISLVLFPDCIQANYTVSNTFCQNSLTLLDKLGIKTRITVTGSRNGYFAQGSLNLLLHLSVTTVTHQRLAGFQLFNGLVLDTLEIKFFFHKKTVLAKLILYS